MLLQLREPHEEREEPYEPSAAVVEADRDPVPGVLDTRAEYPPGVEGCRVAGAARVELELDLQVLVLAPIPEDLCTDTVLDSFKLGDQRLELGHVVDLVRLRAGEVEQREENTVAHRE